MTSHPEHMVDASAYVASLVSGVRTVWGVGASGLVLLDSASAVVAYTVKPFPGEPAEPFSHVSELPSAPTIRWISATVTELTYQVPMALYLDTNDLAEARRKLSPFYGAYLGAFAQHQTLMQNVNSALLTSFAIAQVDGTWAALQMTLRCVERLNLENAA